EAGATKRPRRDTMRSSKTDTRPDLSRRPSSKGQRAVRSKAEDRRPARPGARASAGKTAMAKASASRVALAKRLLAEGFYDRPDVPDAALDRRLDRAAAGAAQANGRRVA